MTALIADRAAAFDEKYLKKHSPAPALGDKQSNHFLLSLIQEYSIEVLLTLQQDY